MRWIEPTPLRSPAPLPDLHPLVAQTLVRRGMSTPEAARAFLDPEAYSPAPAADLPGLTAAAERVERAIRSRASICVWGDFDVDGQTSTTVLVQTLHALGADVTYHIPVRGRESHGVNLPHLKEIIDQGAKLILTCDTGITAHAAGEYARTRRVDMVITDHHDLPESLPQAFAVVNPKLLPPEHALATLAGVGVAYKLAEELIARFPSEPCSPAALLDLVALGLVADLAILKGDARYLVQKGLAALRSTQRLGLQVMLEMAELVPANLTEEHIGFMLGPRLNALGRLGDANPAVELLTTTDPGRARLLATQLENYNAQRQLLCNQVTQAAEAQLRADPSLLANPVLVLGHPAWPGGVVGIVASRLVERYRKPAILFSTPANEPARGSARSVEGLNITAAIAAQKDLLLNFGGHPMAAGLALEQGKLPEFYRRLSRTVGKMLGEAAHEEPKLRIDAWLDLTGVTLDLAAALESLAPFGPGNEKLTLATRGLTMQSTTTIGRNKEHLKLAVADEAGNSQTVLWWSGAGETLPEGKFDLAYTVRASDWRGNRQVQMEFVDFRVIETPPVEIKSKKQEIVDYRNVKDPLTLLPNFHNQPSSLVWAEAEARKEVGGKDRNELERADNLVIWTIPPSPEELQVALDTVKPHIVTLVGAHPFLEVTDAFIARLTGLLKYAITHRAGKVTYAELAAATAQRRITVEQGLNWLISRGNIALVHQEDDQLWVAPGKTINDLGGAARLWVEVQALLAETAAYRAHFKRADKDTLLP
ncbi:MAG: single-stranded-DNA-specific exonuclease RecJ [Chloroflexi bacterium]|nr:single-stranded-DNA-specific exonuclease RecJ [Chloroflexota bacterium]